MSNKQAISDVEREVYIPWTKERGTPVLYAHYLGPGLKRQEILRYEVASDWYDGDEVRCSPDNGVTWTDWQPSELITDCGKGCVRERSPVAWCHDPVADHIVRFVNDRYVMGQGPEALRKFWDTGEKTLFDHGFWQVSSDQGETWSSIYQLCYEPGGYSPDDLNPSSESLSTNRMYASYSAIVTQDNTLIYPVAEVPSEIETAGVRERVEGVLCFIGKWCSSDRRYQWDVSAPIGVSHRISGRGLMEPAIVQLRDGRLLLEMRGSSDAIEKQWRGKVESPGRRWMSLSSDGGYSWSPVTDLRYDNGEQFYSPSTFSSFLRHSRTNKLYWFGNITPSPPQGNLPRYPLYLAEVDESIPAIKKNTLTMIDDYDRINDSPHIQFSNFRILEDRQTGNIELYMTRYGEHQADRLRANLYKYTINFLDL